MAYANFSTPPANGLRWKRTAKSLSMHASTEQSSSRLWNDIATAGWERALRYGKRTTVHGLDRLLATRASRSERFIWLCTCISAFLGAVYVCLILSKRYNDGQLQTVVDSTRYPVYRIPFPVISICNLNRLNWQRIEAAKRRFLPGETDDRRLQLFEQIVAAYDDVSFAGFTQFASLQNEPLAELSHVNFSLVVQFMTWRCDELLTDCYWRHYQYNCCEIFSLRRSFQGLCLAFNTLETPEGNRMKLLDPLWPWRTGSAGPQSGLNVRVLINPEKHYPNRKNEKGISVMLTEPYVWHMEPIKVAAFTQTMVGISPVVYFYDNDTRSVSSDQRRCVFDDERNSEVFKSLNGYVYMLANCKAECNQEYLVRYCNCTLDLLFPPGQYRSCISMDLPCLAQNNEHFRYRYQPGEDEYVRTTYEGMVCNCFRNCYSLNYLNEVRSTFLPMEIHENVSYIDLDLHFRFESLMVYRTSLVFGWVDFLVSFGGIAGLFLGCSLISGLDLAYFVFFEIPTSILSNLHQKCLPRKSTSQVTPTISLSHRHFGLQDQMGQYVLQRKDKPMIQKPTINRWQHFN